VLSSSTSPDADDATQTNVDNNTDYGMLLNSLTDSFSQSEEVVEQMMSRVNIN
jgi:hypothetical protein